MEEVQIVATEMPADFCRRPLSDLEVQTFATEVRTVPAMEVCPAELLTLEVQVYCHQDARPRGADFSGGAVICRRGAEKFAAEVPTMEVQFFLPPRCTPQVPVGTGRDP
ncbi:expressed unknown protein [Seminavis robusta]|uniref:Uncharacterized protein n=1 Tax=Seminavis robusta TaxID=568900 RepID=A0A9N8DPC8_9STRA|nr:expressed unknown protein [Seminavis robusta]|eukprot:Sro275_g336211.1  (109) ;mRNA; r:6983-7309